MNCYKHKDVEAPLSCGRCEQPICTKCSTHTDVGIRCKSCAPTGMRPKMMRTGGSVLGGAIILILVIVAATSLFDLGNGSGDYYGDYIDDAIDDYVGEVTVTQWIDPWEPGDGSGPAAEGNRLIAAEITIENDTPGILPVYVYSSSLKVTDSENFVFTATESRLEPAMSEGLTLDPGEKTKGWVMFEVGEDSEIEKMQYWTSEVPIPDQD